MAEARAAARRSPTSLKYASRAGGGLAARLEPHLHTNPCRTPGGRGMDYLISSGHIYSNILSFEIVFN